MRGTVSALSVQAAGQEGLLAAGTWTRWVGLYDLNRAGNCVVANWGVASAAEENGVGGRGIVQTVWSPCGRYLVVNERGAGGMLVYDLRGTNQLLGTLKGRDGYTNQRLSCDVFPGTEEIGGFEVWAGTRDGGVVVYEGVGMREGDHEPAWSTKAHGSAVGSTAMHLSGSVLATCSGSWAIVDDEASESESESEGDSESESSSGSSDEEGGGSGSSNDEPALGSGVRQSKKQSGVVVGETSLKIWSISAGNPPQHDEPPLGKEVNEA